MSVQQHANESFAPITIVISIPLLIGFAPINKNYSIDFYEFFSATKNLFA